MSATISRRANKWFVSITVEMPEGSIKTANENQVAVGVDLGIKHFATLSTGEKIQGPKPHKRLLNRVKRLSRSLSRKKKGSKNRQKAKLKLACLHAKIANIRQDAIHQLTTQLTENYSHIGIEDLNVKGMMQNRRLSRSIADMSFYEFRRQMEYKTRIRNKTLVIVDRWYASSKICSNTDCGFKNTELRLSDREWICPQCKKQHDRDLNSAINLEKKAVSSTVRANSAYACGAASDGIVALASISHVALKQESNSNLLHR
jgi:putative transposase